MDELPNTVRALINSDRRGKEPLSFMPPLPFRSYPNKRSPKQIVDDLGLKVNDFVPTAGGDPRKIVKITGDGRVFVEGMPGHINVYALLENTETA